MGKANHRRLAQQPCHPEPFASAHPERRCVAPKSKDAQDKLREGSLREILRSAQNDTPEGSQRKVHECCVFRLRTLNSHPHGSGFTLLEVLITLSLLGILVGILTLQLEPLLSQVRLRDATRQMVANLQYVRMKAVSQNRRLRVTFRPTTSDYIVDRDEDGVWQRQLLYSHSVEEVAEATILLPRGVRIAAVNSSGDIVFLPRGAVDGGISITLGAASGGDTRRVVVNLAGRVRVE
jgi:type IV fimbrial biogenesis protein FimT